MTTKGRGPTAGTYVTWWITNNLETAELSDFDDMLKTVSEMAEAEWKTASDDASKKKIEAAVQVANTVRSHAADTFASAQLETCKGLFESAAGRPYDKQSAQETGSNRLPITELHARAIYTTIWARLPERGEGRKRLKREASRLCDWSESELRNIPNNMETRNFEDRQIAGLLKGARDDVEKLGSTKLKDYIA
jgi:hypothetical protein